MPSTSPARACDDAVRTVRADDHFRAHRVGSDTGRDAGLVQLERLHARAVPKLRSKLCGLLGEERVQPPALRHPDQRLVVRAGEARAVAQAKLEAIDVALHDG